MTSPPSVQAGRTSANWFASEASRRLSAFELRQIIPILSTHIGVRGLFLRPDLEAPNELSGNMLQSVVAVHRAAPGQFAGQARFATTELPFAADTFSLVCALHVLEHGEDAESLVEEVARCLQPEGLLVALVLSRSSLWGLRWLGRGLRVPTTGRMRALIEASGLSIEIHRQIGTMWRVPDADDPSASMPRLPLLRALSCSQLWVARKRRATLTPQRQTASARVPASMGLR